MKPECSLPELPTYVVSFNWIKSSNVWIYRAQKSCVKAHAFVDCDPEVIKWIIVSTDS